MKTAKYCTHHVITAKQDCPIPEAARLMRKHHVGCLVVVSEEDESLPVGIVTDRDLVVEILAEDISPETVTVRDIMTHLTVLAREEDDILTSLKLMDERGIRRLPVTNGDNELTGILSTDDVARVIHDQIGHIVSIYKREMEHERKARL